MKLWSKWSISKKISKSIYLYGKIAYLSVWPKLAKFRHFGKTLKVFGYSLRVCFVLGKIVNLFGQIFMMLDTFSLLLMAQYWKHNLTIWSHCCYLRVESKIRAHLCILDCFLPRLDGFKARSEKLHKTH